MKKIRILRLVVASMVVVGLTVAAKPTQSLPPDLQKRVDRIAQQMGTRLNEASLTRGKQGIKDYAEGCVFTHEVIQDKAREQGLTASKEEVKAALVPYLAQLRVSDPVAEPDFTTSSNVKYWLLGQSMTMDDLLEAGEDIVLWTKIVLAEQGGKPTSKQLEDYVKNNPDIMQLPVRVRLEISDFVPPSGISSRSVLPAEMVSPLLDVNGTREMKAFEKSIPEPWKNLNLFLPLDGIDQALRRVLEGKGTGQSFGPVQLSNAAIVSGKILEILPAAKLEINDDFWRIVAIRYTLDKAEQFHVFEPIADAFIEKRGFWSTIKNGVKKSFSYLGGAAGGVAGYFLGGPSGAVAGAKLGYGVGNAIKSFWRNPTQAQGFNQGPAYQQQFAAPQGVAYQGSLPSWPSFNMGTQYQYGVGAIPAMQPQYMYNPMPAMPMQQRWYPPIWMGYPVF